MNWWNDWNPGTQFAFPGLIRPFLEMTFQFSGVKEVTIAIWHRGRRVISSMHRTYNQSPASPSR
jgi:hypothetical protein